MPITFSITVDFAVWYLEHKQFHVSPFDQHPLTEPATDRLSADEWLKWFQLSVLVDRMYDTAAEKYHLEQLLEFEFPEWFPENAREGARFAWRWAYRSDYDDEEREIIKVLEAAGIPEKCLPLGVIGLLMAVTGWSEADAEHLYTSYEANRGELLLSLVGQTWEDESNGFLVAYKPLQTKGHLIKIMNALKHDALSEFGIYC
jgi:hypothetical protein